ncbi:MAG TPA: peptidylprolyl isomerase [Candidatus Angelobacter sp.]|nr:peptidylprolyl isomerase [Candidatus Angelobacter sp.]
MSWNVVGATLERIGWAIDELKQSDYILHGMKLRFVLFLLIFSYSFAAAPVPNVFRVKIETTAGNFVIEAHRDWAPNGVDRFHELVIANFFNDSRFFRVVPGFVAQFGVAGKPEIAQAWRERTFSDDPVIQSNLRGFVSYAMTGPNTRATQLFINLADNARLDVQGFASIGKVVEGMEVVDKLYSGYGETSGGGMRAGKQEKLFQEGNAWLDREFPKLDKLIRAVLLTAGSTQRN